MSIGEGFGGRLGQLRRERALRLGRDLPQAEVAKALGIPPATYSRLETGLFKRSPELTTLQALAKYYGVTLGWLWFGEGERSAEPTSVGALVAEPAPPRRHAAAPATKRQKGGR